MSTKNVSRSFYSLREAREKRGLTQQEVADELGVSRQTYIRFEKKPEKANVRQARRLCEILSCSYDGIFFGKNVS